MARNRNILLTLTTESSIVLVASMVAFRLHEVMVMSMEVSVFILVAIYACLKTLSILCLPTINREVSGHQRVPMEVWATDNTPNLNDGNIQKQRMELFHQEYQYEQQQYVQRKEKADETKLQAVVKYTKDSSRIWILKKQRYSNFVSASAILSPTSNLSLKQTFVSKGEQLSLRLH